MYFMLGGRRLEQTGLQEVITLDTDRIPHTQDHFLEADFVGVCSM
jgi:hypothetical protein